MSKDYTTVLIEAFIVGGLLVVLFNFIKIIIPDYSQTTQLFITGAAFHILCEISGLNLWYVKNYLKLNHE